MNKSETIHDTVIRLGRRRATMMVIGNDEALHGLVYSGTPEVKGRVLYRLDEDKAGRYLTVRSSSVPDYTNVVEEYGWPRLPYEEQVSTSTVRTDYHKGDSLSFVLRANTVRRNGRKERTVYSHDDLVQWLIDRSHVHGFRLVSVAVLGTGHMNVAKRRHVSMPWADYAGRLMVEDADAFARTLSEGLGRGKAYGMGLLMVTGSKNAGRS